jgi:hypothetical protein
MGCDVRVIDCRLYVLWQWENRGLGRGREGRSRPTYKTTVARSYGVVSRIASG